MANKIMLEFHASRLSAADQKKAEELGMLLLASDFIKSGRVNKADKLDGILKIAIPFYFAKTKSGGYIGINPSSADAITVPVTRLPAMSDLTEFCSKPENLMLKKLKKELLKIETADTQLRGGLNTKQLEVIKLLLAAQRNDRNDFTPLPPTISKTQFKEDISKINELVYDDTGLQKAIDERLTLFEKVLKDEATAYAQKYTERQNYWKAEMQTTSSSMATKIKERDAKLVKDKQDLQKNTKKLIEDALREFLGGIAKNIRKDELVVEASIQDLEKLVKKTPNRELVDDIEAKIKELADHTQTFNAAVNFANVKIRDHRGKEGVFDADESMEIERLEKIADRDKALLKEEYDKKEAERDAELATLKEDAESSKIRLAKFKEEKTSWSAELKMVLGEKGTPMLSPTDFTIETPGNFIELLIPHYVFQYSKDTDKFYIAVPPVRLPDKLKKPKREHFSGDYSTIYYELLIPDAYDLTAKWFEKNADNVDMRTKLDTIDNQLSDPNRLRDLYFNNQKLLLDTIGIDKKSNSEATGRLNHVFASG